MSRTPIHAGEILKDELAELDISCAELARQIDVPANRISKIVAGKRAITAETALLLGKWFGISPTFWLNLQQSYDLKIAQRDIGKKIDQIQTRKWPSNPAELGLLTDA